MSFIIVDKKVSEGNYIYRSAADAWTYDGKWAHVAVVYDPSNDHSITLYTNGLPASMEASVTNGTYVAMHFVKGNPNGLRYYYVANCLNNFANGNFWYGGIDDVYVFSNALTDTQILVEFNKSQGTHPRL